MPLLGEAISGNNLMNGAYVAHIVGEKPTGPRGDPIRSPQLGDDVDNLMLLCDLHHRLIDRDGQADHPEEVLLAMKREHEARVELVTSITPNMASHVILYGARVGEHDCPVRLDLAKLAMLPQRYPAEPRAIELALSGADLKDSEADYWAVQRDNLVRQFEKRVRERVASGEVRHLSVFALAPQPLLVQLGVLLGDIALVSVHQLHREPPGWDWRTARNPVSFQFQEGAANSSKVALKLALSATVSDDRIQAVLGSDASIWSVTTPQPHNDVLHREDELSEFRSVIRGVFDRVKATHGQDAELHVFPVLPVAAAIEFGRVWMPKADLPLVLYDHDRTVGAFVPRFTIGRSAASGPSAPLAKEAING